MGRPPTSNSPSSSSDDEEKAKLASRGSSKRRQLRSTSTSSSTNPISSIALVLAALLLWRFSETLAGSVGAHETRGTRLRDLSEAGQAQWEETIDRCSTLHDKPGVPASFWNRTQSDRFVAGTPPVLIRNATVWTGLHDGKQVLYNYDVLLGRGLILGIGEGLNAQGLKVVDAKGAWLTPGIVDMHSHIGVDSLPELSGSDDTNSVAAPILPHLRSLDGINTHDLAYRRTVAGGVTTSLVLPGSANSIGGQAFPIKLRPTKERTPDSLVIEMPWNVKLPSGERRKKGDPPRWRHMKMACGEVRSPGFFLSRLSPRPKKTYARFLHPLAYKNIRRVHHQTRLDLSWNFRSAFDSARTLKRKQEAFCSRALAAHARGEVEEGEFPDDLKLEALVDVLRGKVLVNTHCYESTDLDAMVRHTHEFEFPIAAFHHAHEAYLVPDLLKQAYGSHTPAVALFATNARYKREAWRGSEYAPKVLSENNITSDHPVTDSRYLLFEAQQAHHFGLPAHVALSAVTTSPARIAGLAHRVGSLQLNHDADVVLWSSHPLSLGATPQQVWIDGVPQLEKPHPLPSPAEDEIERRNGPASASLPESYDPLREQDDGFDFDGEAGEGKEWVKQVKFVNVKEALLPSKAKERGLVSLAEQEGIEGLFEVIVKEGRVTCLQKTCKSEMSASRRIRVVDLKGGSLLPPFVGFGPALGLTEMISVILLFFSLHSRPSLLQLTCPPGDRSQEKTTTDAPVYDPLFSGELSRTQQKWGPNVAVRAVDGISFGGKHLQVAEQSGVGKAVTAPLGNGLFRGVSVAFRTGAKNVLEPGAILSEDVALHVTIGSLALLCYPSPPVLPDLVPGTGHYKASQTPSISTEIAELRGLLLDGLVSDPTASPASVRPTWPAQNYFARVAKGDLPLVINAWKADVLASLVKLKREIENKGGRPGKLRWIIHGGQEAHLIADELAAAHIGVILSPPRSFPESWDERRALPGPPLTEHAATTILHEAGVKLALGIPEEWMTRTLLFEAAWAQRLSRGHVSRAEAISWISTNLDDLLGSLEEHASSEGEDDKVEFVAFERDPFEFGSRMVAMSKQGGVELRL
ncbi:SPOSA6832_04872, partial [Sporobolomyces salmonicolor]